MEIALTLVLGAALALGLRFLIVRYASFSAQRPGDYADGAQNFDIRARLNGTILCEGVIFGPRGRVTSRFVGEFQAHWQGNRGIMKEEYLYDSGERQSREWHLRVTDSGEIDVTAPDVIGTGRGRQLGSAVQLNYRLRLPDSSGGHVLSVNDWMYLAPNGTIVNRSQFRKFGVTVAELVATMRTLPDSRAAAA